MFDQHSNIADGSRNKKCLISNQALRVLDNHKLQICAFYFPTFEKADCTMFVDGSVGWSVGVAINFPFPNCVTHPRTDQVPPCTIRRLSIKCILDKFWTASVMLLVWKKVNVAISGVIVRSRAHICHDYHKLYSWRKKLPCGENSAFHLWQLWGNWKFFDVWKLFGKFGEILPQFTRFHVEKNWAQRFICGEKWQIWGLHILKTIRSNPIMIILRPCAEYWLQKELYTWHCAMDRKKPFSNE